MATVSLSLSGAERIVPGLWALLAAGPFLLLREWTRRFIYTSLQIVPAIMLDATAAMAQLGGLLLLWRFQMLSIFTIFGVMGASCALACAVWYAIDRPIVHFESHCCASRLEAQLVVRSVGSAELHRRQYDAVHHVLDHRPVYQHGCCGGARCLRHFDQFVQFVPDQRGPHPNAEGRPSVCSRWLRRSRRVLTLAAAALLSILGRVLLSRVRAWFAFGRVRVWRPICRSGVMISALAAVMFMNSVGMISGNGLWRFTNLGLIFWPTS